MAATRRAKENGLSADRLRQMEGRLTRLEQELRRLQEQLGEGKPAAQPWWQRTAGIFEDNSLMDQVVKEIEKNRRADYASARVRTGATGTGKSRRAEPRE